MKNWVDGLMKEGGGGMRGGWEEGALESPYKHCESVDFQLRSEEFLSDPRQGTMASWK